MSDIRHTASLEVVVYGRSNLQEITKALQDANIQFDKLETNAEEAASATKRFGNSQVSTSKVIVQGARNIAKAQEAIAKTQQSRLVGKSKGISNITKYFSDTGSLKLGNTPEGINPKLIQDVQKSYAKIIAASDPEKRENAIQELERKVYNLNKGVERALRADSKKTTDIISGYSKQISQAEKELDKLQKAINKEVQSQDAVAQEIGAKRVAAQKKRQRQEELIRENARKQEARIKENALKKEEKAATEAVKKDERAAKARLKERLAMQESFKSLARQQELNRIYKAPSEAESLMASIKNRENQIKSELKRDRLRLRADKERDKATEEYITSFIPKQMQPFFRRGGLFMQGMYRMKSPELGPFGGIRGALGGRAGGGAYGSEDFQPSGPARVIIYDALRRILTDVYSSVTKIATTFKDWVIEGVKFNDELVRARTFFTSLGLLGIKGATGEEITVAEASVSTNVKTKQAYEKSTQAAEEMMNRMMAVSALTGQDLGEIVSSARQSMTDLLNKVNKTSGGKTNAFLEDPKMFGDVTERMVKLASVLRMADPQNRKLGFHMVGLQELFSGSSGGKKDSGLQNVLSLLRREGIKIEGGVAKEITTLVNKGDITGAMDIVEDALSRAGLGMVQLKNMLTSTLQPAIDGSLMFAKIFNRIFTKAFYDRTLLPFFRAVLETFDAIYKNEKKMATLEKLGVSFSKAMDPIADRLAEIIDFITTGLDDPKTIKQVENALSTIGGVMELALAFSELIAAFVAGIMGQADSTQLKSLAEWTRSWTDSVFKLGKKVRSLVEWLQALDDKFGDILKTTALVVAIGILIVGTFSTIAAVILGVVVPTLWLINGFRRLAGVLGIVGTTVKALTSAAEASSGANKPRAAGMPSVDLSGRRATTPAEVARQPGAASRAASTARTVGTAVATRAIPAAIRGGPVGWAAILGLLAGVGGSTIYDMLAGNKETDGKPPTPGKETRGSKVVTPTPTGSQKPGTVNNVNAPVTINIQGGAGQDALGLADRVSAAVTDSFRAIFSN